MDERRWQNAVGIAVAVLFVIGFGLSRVIGGAGTGDGPAATCDDPVDWQQAGTSTAGRPQSLDPWCAQPMNRRSMAVRRS